MMENKVDQLLDLVDIEPDALREAEFMQAQSILDTLVGKSITEATIDETRIVVTTSDGSKYFFYGFLGGGSAA
ncbi:MAG: hypothetical protein M3160_07660 [Candidatus Eremiobacteraeota bacterium]|nr:hypothetical protein [Candidatus Eremiobacteraeota bacterium]